LSTPALLAPPHPVRFRGSRLARALLAMAGWRVLEDGFPARQGVAIVYPHTSNWDFVVGVLAKWSIGIPVRFWGKDTLFDVPLFGRWLRWLGGMPIERHSPRGAVGAMVHTMREAVSRDELLWLALSPEGTRRLLPGGARRRRAAGAGGARLRQARGTGARFPALERRQQRRLRPHRPGI
jgi:1-acyl-sn-glycerol-3-phosphate acyltransferase